MTTARYFLRNSVVLGDGTVIKAGRFVTTRLGDIGSAGGVLLSDNDITRSASALCAKLEATGADVNTLDMTAQFETRQFGAQKGDPGVNGEGTHTFDDLAACMASPSASYVANDAVSFPGFHGVWEPTSGAGFDTDADGLTCIKPDDVLVSNPGRIVPTTTNGSVTTLAALRATQNTNVKLFNVKAGATEGDGLGGLFWMLDGDTTSVDNGYSIIKRTVGGARLHRQSHSKEMSPARLAVAFDSSGSLSQLTATVLGTETVHTANTNPGDGCSNSWHWDAASTQTADGISIANPSGASAGRWIVDGTCVQVATIAELESVTATHVKEFRVLDSARGGHFPVLLATGAYLSGAGVPDAGLGSNGDSYLRTSNTTVYLKSAGSWTLATEQANGGTLLVTAGGLRCKRQLAGPPAIVHFAGALDARSVTNAVCAASDKTVTSATLAATAADVGKIALVVGGILNPLTGSWSCSDGDALTWPALSTWSDGGDEYNPVTGVLRMKSGTAYHGIGYAQAGSVDPWMLRVPVAGYTGSPVLVLALYTNVVAFDVAARTVLSATSGAHGYVTTDTSNRPVFVAYCDDQVGANCGIFVCLTDPAGVFGNISQAGDGTTSITLAEVQAQDPATVWAAAGAATTELGINQPIALNGVDYTTKSIRVDQEITVDPAPSVRVNAQTLYGPPDHLLTTIDSINSATSVELHTAPTASGSGMTLRVGSDDTAAWQAAHDALPAEGGVVWMPRGESFVSEALLLDKPFHIDGTGRQASIIRAVSRGYHALSSRATVVLEDLSLVRDDGPQVVGTNDAGVVIWARGGVPVQAGSRLVISRANVTGFENPAGVYNSAAKECESFTTDDVTLASNTLARGVGRFAPTAYVDSVPVFAPHNTRFLHPDGPGTVNSNNIYTIACERISFTGGCLVQQGLGCKVDSLSGRGVKSANFGNTHFNKTCLDVEAIINGTVGSTAGRVETLDVSGIISTDCAATSGASVMLVSESTAGSIADYSIGSLVAIGSRWTNCHGACILVALGGAPGYTHYLQSAHIAHCTVDGYAGPFAAFDQYGVINVKHLFFDHNHANARDMGGRCILGITGTESQHVSDWEDIAPYDAAETPARAGRRYSSTGFRSPGNLGYALTDAAGTGVIQLAVRGTAGFGVNDLSWGDATHDSYSYASTRHAWKVNDKFILVLQETIAELGVPLQLSMTSPFALLQDNGIDVLFEVTDDHKLGFYKTPSQAMGIAVTGSRGGNAALADLLTKLAAFGLITDSTN